VSGSASTSLADGGALLVSLERTWTSLCPDAQQQGNPSISNPAGLICMVAAVGDPLRVLAKKILLGNFCEMLG
jgi:hypothetical protein